MPPRRVLSLTDRVNRGDNKVDERIKSEIKGASVFVSVRIKEAGAAADVAYRADFFD